MRDYARISSICELLKACWMHCPDQRFFQLISNIYHSDKADSFYIEDEETEKMMKEFLEKAINGKDN